MSTLLIQGPSREKLEKIAKGLDGPPFRSMSAHDDGELISELHTELTELVKALLEAKES
jgi:hypothetical protein